MDIDPVGRLAAASVVAWRGVGAHICHLPFMKEARTAGHRQPEGAQALTFERESGGPQERPPRARGIDPLDLGLAQKRVGQPSETNADNSIVSFGVRSDAHARELSCHCSRQFFLAQKPWSMTWAQEGVFGGDTARHGHAAAKNLRGISGLLN